MKRILSLLLCSALLLSLSACSNTPVYDPLDGVETDGEWITLAEEKIDRAGALRERMVLSA